MNEDVKNKKLCMTYISLVKLEFLIDICLHMHVIFEGQGNPSCKEKL
jgi:hypothetical protein